MQVANTREVINYLRRIDAPLPIRRALGDYGTGDPNTHNQPVYNERDVFYAPGGTSGGVQIVKPPIIQNLNSFALYPFVIGVTGLAVQILPANSKRTLLIVQNQASSAATLYVNFSADAGTNLGIALTQGAGIILDTVCPNNSVSVFYAGGANQPGVVIEGAPQS